MYLNHYKIMYFESFKLPDHWSRETAVKHSQNTWIGILKALSIPDKNVGPYPSLSPFTLHSKAIFVADLSQTAGVKITLDHCI